jgi:hypothetical protein
MGAGTELDLDAVRALADRVLTAAAAIADFPIPGLGAEDLRGSAVVAATAPQQVAAELSDVAAALRGWAASVRASADAFAAVEQRNAARIDPP